MQPLARALVLLSFSIMLSAQTPPAPAPAAAPSPPAAKLTESLVRDWPDLKPETRLNGVKRAVFDHPTATLANFECHITTLNPGEVSGPAHTHDTPNIIEEVILLKEGSLEVQVNGTRKTVTAGAVVYFAPQDLVAVKNVGKTPAVYFVVGVQVAAAVPAAAK